MKLYLFTFLLSFVLSTVQAKVFDRDTYPTSLGELSITFIGHGTLMFQVNGKTIHVDPWTKRADYAALPKADLILITYAHSDHLDTAAIRKISKQGTVLIANAETVEKINHGIVMKNGESC